MESEDGRWSKQVRGEYRRKYYGTFPLACQERVLAGDQTSLVQKSTQKAQRMLVRLDFPPDSTLLGNSRSQKVRLSAIATQYSYVKIRYKLHVFSPKHMYPMIHGPPHDSPPRTTCILKRSHPFSV